MDLLSHHIHDKLERQNLCRWTVENTPWDRSLIMLAAGVWEVVDYDTERMAGDTYSEPAKAFQPGVAGYYNIKAWLDFTISTPAITLYDLTEITFGYRINVNGVAGSWVVGQRAYNQFDNTLTPMYLRGCSLVCADTVGLVPGMELQFGFMYQGVALDYMDSFESRFLVEKVADYYVNSESPCCG